MDVSAGGVKSFVFSWKFAVPALILILAFAGWQSIPSVAKKASSDSQCTVVQQGACGGNPIAVNEKFSWYFAPKNDNVMCTMSMRPHDYIKDRAVEENGKCVLNQSIRKGCLESYKETKELMEENEKFHGSQCTEAVSRCKNMTTCTVG